MNNQPEALRLAEESENDEWIAGTRQWQQEAATELRRLHKVNQMLIDELTEMLCWQSLAPEHVVISAKAVLAKATGESNA